MKKIFDNFEHKFVKISDNDLEAIKTDTYLQRRYDVNKVKSNRESNNERTTTN